MVVQRLGILFARSRRSSVSKLLGTGRSLPLANLGPTSLGGCRRSLASAAAAGGLPDLIQPRSSGLLSAQAQAQTTREMNMCQSINDAMAIALETKKETVLIGEDVAFGGVFRCSDRLQERFGADRVLNAPICEQGIMGFGIGMATTGFDVIAEMQFADYIFPAFDQIVSEAAKYRYRSGGTFNVGGLTIRAPCSAVGHGATYHSQSVEAFFAHCAGLKVVVPRGAVEAKGLLLSCIRERDPCLFFEPKILYRSAVAQVPEGDYMIPLGKGEVVREGADLTMVAWGTQVHRLLAAAQQVEVEDGISCEVIDLQSIVPWDRQLVCESVRRTGRLLVSHEAQQTAGFGAEVAAAVAEQCFLSLEAPVKRVCGYDTPFPLTLEEFYLPSRAKIVQGIRETMAY